MMECGQDDPPDREGHLGPSAAAAMAGIARPGVLVLTHVYPPLTPDAAVAKVMDAGYDGRVVAGTDGLRLGL